MVMIAFYNTPKGYNIARGFLIISCVFFGRNFAIGSTSNPNGLKYSVDVFRFSFLKVHFGLIEGTYLDILGQITTFPLSDPDIIKFLSSLEI